MGHLKRIDELEAELADKLLAAPSLDISLLDDLRGESSRVRRHRGVLFRRPRSTNSNQSRDQEESRMTDQLWLVLDWQLVGSGQRQSRAEAQRLASRLVNRITDIQDRTLRPYGLRLTEETETPRGAWLTITLKLEAKRDQRVGQG